MSVQDVLARHQEGLMALPGVTGVGIGEREGRPVILVMLDRPLAELPGQIPEQVEGVPVEVEVVGEITAF